MREQREIAYDRGNDTFVRDYQDDKFRKSTSETFQMQVGEVEITEPEPLFRQNFVTVSLARNGRHTTVPYPGAFIDPITGNMHGSYEGPIPGQMVLMGYENGNRDSPIVVNKYPYQGKGNTFTEVQYITPLTKSLFDSTDVIMGHFAGSYLSFNTGILSGKLPGSVSLYSVTEFTSECLLGTKVTQDSGIKMTTVFESGSTFNLTADGALISNASGYKIEMSVSGIVLQDGTGLNKIEIGPSGIIFTVGGITYGAATHIHPTPVGPSSPPVPNT